MLSGGERKTLRLVARYGDACNLFDLPGTAFGGDLRHKLAVLRGHCAAVGRDPREIEKTAASAFDLGEDQDAGLADLLSHLRELADIGIDHAILSPRGPWNEASLAAVASILPEVHAMPVTS